MERQQTSLASIALTLLLLDASLGPVSPVGPAAGNVGNVADRPDGYAIEQADRCIPLEVAGNASENVSAYYDYRPGDEGDWSSHGTTERQESQVSQLYVYRGREGDSLVFLHDEWNNDDSEGGAVSMNVTGIPANATWAVEDDDYENRDDNFDHRGTSSRIDWMWAPNRTDGGALRGIALPGGDGVQIDARFNGDSDAAREQNWNWADDSVDWRARGTDGELVPLDENETATLRQGDCEANDPPSASLAAEPTNATVGEPVTFDASASTDPDGEISQYRWDLNGDGQFTEATTTEPTLSWSFNDTGTAVVGVEVVDGTGLNDTDSVRVSVLEPENATASINGPANATVGERVTFDANGSGGQGELDYQWELGDNTTATGQTVSTSYDAPGTYQVTLTVVDQTDQRDTATTTVNVTRDTAPTAALAAPESTFPGDLIRLDASNATDDGEIVSYRWDLDGDGERDETTNSPIAETRFDETGNYTVGVTVVDEREQTDTARRAIQIAESRDRDPDAALAVPDQVSTDETMTLDASNSTVPRGAAEYRWDLDGDGEADTVTQTARLTTRFGAAETRQVAVTVVDRRGYEATASAQVAVESADGDTGSSEPSDGSDSAGSEPSGGDDSSDSDPSGSTVSSSSGGGGGGVAPPADRGPDTRVGVSSNGTTVAIADASAGETVDVSLDAGAVGTGPTSVDRAWVNVTGEETNLTLASEAAPPAEASGPPNGSDETLVTVRPTVRSADAPRTVTYRFALDARAVERAGGSVDDVVAAGWNGSAWTTAETTVAENGTTAELNATVDGTDAVTLAVPRANLTAESLTVDGGAVRGEPTTVTTTVRNTGARNGTEVVNATLDGTVVGSERVRVAPNETATVSFQIEPASAGTKRLAVGDESERLRVRQAAANVSEPTVRVENESVEPGQAVVVAATFANDGPGRATFNAEFAVGGDVVEVKRVSIPAEENETVRFTRTVDRAGTYAMAVDGTNVTVDVGGAAEATRTTDGGPLAQTENRLALLAGLGLVLAGIALMTRQV